MTPTEATVRARAAIARQPDAQLLLEALLRCGLIRATHGGRDVALCKSCRDYAQFAGELATWCAA